MCETRRALRECPGGQQYHKRRFQVRAKRILRTLAKKAHPKADALADSIHKSRSSSVLAAFPFSSLLDAATCTSLVQLCAVASFDDGARANMTMWNLVNLATAYYTTAWDCVAALLGSLHSALRCMLRCMLRHCCTG